MGIAEISLRLTASSWSFRSSSLSLVFIHFLVKLQQSMRLTIFFLSLVESGRVIESYPLSVSPTPELFRGGDVDSLGNEKGLPAVAI